MKYLFFLLFLFSVRSVFPQCNDSIVINNHFENNSFTNTRFNSISYLYYHLDSGSVTTVSYTYMNGSWSSPSTNTTTYNRTDSMLNGSGQLTELLSLEGTGTGWNPKTSVRYSYNTFGSLASETHLQWNGSAWDSTGLELWNFDGQNNLISNETFTYSLGVSVKNKKTDIIYNNGHEDTIIFYQGDTSNIWINKKMYVFYYSGLLRTSAEIYHADSLGNWTSSGIYNYFYNSFNKWVIEIQNLTPVVISGTNLFDTLTIQMDTVERTMYSRTWHYSLLDEAGMSEVVYDIINNKLVRIQDHYSEMVAWIIPPNWDVLDRTDRRVYTFDSIPQLIHLSESGACTNPCGAEIDYSYDAFGRIVHYVYDWESMVNEIYKTDDYEYLDSSAINILIPSWENNIVVCPNDSIQPIIFTSGTCNVIHYQWYPSSGLSSDTIINPLISVNDSTTYTIVAYDNSGISDTAYLTILPRHVDTAIFLDSLFCDGTAMLSMNFSQATYNWYLNDISTLVNHSRQMYAISPGNYFCMGTYAAGNQNQLVCTYSSDTVTLTTSSAVIDLSNDTIYSLSRGVLFEWYEDSILIATTTDSFIVANQTGNYYALVTDSNGCVRSSNVVYYSIINVPEISQFISISFEEDILKISNSAGKRFNVSVFDSAGRLFVNEFCSEKIMIIDMNAFRNGVYLVIIEQDGEVISRKLVLN